MPLPVRAGFARILSECHAITLVLQDLRQQLADADLVVDDEDFARLRHPRVNHGPASCRSGAFQRPEMQRYARAVRRDIFERHATRVLVDDLLHDC